MTEGKSGVSGPAVPGRAYATVATADKMGMTQASTRS